MSKIRTVTVSSPDIWLVQKFEIKTSESEIRVSQKNWAGSVDRIQMTE